MIVTHVGASADLQAVDDVHNHYLGGFYNVSTNPAIGLTTMTAVAGTNPSTMTKEQKNYQDMRNIICIFLLVYITSCNLTANKNESADIVNDKLETEGIDSILFNINQNLLKELNDFIFELDHSDSIIAVIFYQKEDECFVAITPTQIYHEDISDDGYIVLNNIIVAFYNNNSICYKNFVDASKLKKRKEFSDKIPHGSYDPIGKTFKIHGDSLQLIFHGHI